MKLLKNVTYIVIHYQCFAKKKKRRKKLRTTSEFLEMLKNAPAQVKNMTS